MSDTVIYNGVKYDVEKIILMKGAKAAINISKQTNVQNAFSSDKIKYPIVIPVGDDFYTLIKPAVEAKNPSVAFVLSKFTLKKLRDEPVVDSVKFDHQPWNPVLTQVVATRRPTTPVGQPALKEQARELQHTLNKFATVETTALPVVKLTGIEVLRERARVQQQEYQSRNQHDDRQNNYNRNSY